MSAATVQIHEVRVRCRHCDIAPGEANPTDVALKAAVSGLREVATHHAFLEPGHVAEILVDGVVKHLVTLSTLGSVQCDVCYNYVRKELVDRRDGLTICERCKRMDPCDGCGHVRMNHGAEPLGESTFGDCHECAWEAKGGRCDGFVEKEES